TVYQVHVTTGDVLYAGTMNNVLIKLVGTDGESDQTLLYNKKGGFYQGSVSEGNSSVKCPVSLGKLVLIEVEKQKYSIFPEDDWFCSKIAVTTPDGDSVSFPCYRWLWDREKVVLMESTAKRVFDDSLPLAQYHREKELQSRQMEYRWSVYMEGIPQCLKADSPTSLPAAVRFSFKKSTEFAFNNSYGLAELKLKDFTECKQQWTKMEDIKRVFCTKRTEISAYVQEHWKEDAFFGYQFLNGVNPMVIKRCSKLPRNFPVTDDMVRPFLEPGTCLAAELQRGNIFLCDYKILEGLPTNAINQKQQYQAAPLCLLYKNAEDKLLPIAIQLNQQPGDLNPIFLPSDCEHDWLLAKMCVRSAEFCEHQLNSHLLRAHLLAEVFAMATLRTLPMVHPLYKLLIPHTRYTLQINHMARQVLISETGSFTQISSIGGAGISLMLKRALSSLTYSSLCLPSVPNFYYRDDGLRLWNIINKFVQGIVCHYYSSDMEVQKDSELQSWIREIFVHGFLERSIPQSFSKVEEVVKFVTMVIFTGSAQHAAVNSGQFDFGAWIPNNPFTMQRPLPTAKGNTSQNTILQTLPDINISVQGMSIFWVLSRTSSDFVALGVYPEEYFTESVPCKLIKKMQRKLKGLSEEIKERNAELKLPYPYLCPEEVENSVAI
uniref:Hydroperoxide isomerase ALOXE3-like n=1 Tax=Scleropages formosus TaxID=113540 RepID=A0A8C9V277_SCLFO